MKLTSKIVILLLVFWLFLLMGYIFIYNRVIKPTLTQFERKLATEELERFNKTIEKELLYLNRTCADYAWWDDTYEFVINKNETYKKINLLPQTFEENNINMILILNTQGEVVFGEWYNLEKKQYEELPVEFSISKLALTHPLLSFDNTKAGKYGIIFTNYGNVAVSANKILNSKVEGEPRGIFIMGRLLNDKYWENIKSQTMLEVSVYPYIEKDRLIIDASSYIINEKKTIFIHESKDGKLFLWDIINDINGNPILLIQLIHLQNILSASENMRFQGIMGFILVIVVGIVALWWAIKKQIIVPIQDLTQNIRNSIYRESITFLPNIEKNDEIALLIVHFNRMAYRINKLLEEKSKLLIEIAEREEYLKFIINAIPCVILEMDNNGIIKTVNSAIEKIMEINSKDIEGKNICNVFPLKSILDFIERIKINSEELGYYEVEDILYTINNEKKYLHIYFQKNKRNGKEFYIGVIWDITVLREIQEKYNEQRQLAILGEASASLAHELRNMISAIQSGFRLMQEEKNIKNGEKIVNELYISIFRLEETLKKLLEFTKKYKINKIRVSLKDIIEEQYKKCLIYQEKDIELRVDGNIFAWIDINLFPNAVWNILKNSIESIKEKGIISVQLYEQDGLQYIEINDNGIGIDETYLNKVGTPFFTTKAQGTGLGLTITKKIIESHGGRIQIRSKKDIGTCVSIILPIEEG